MYNHAIRHFVLHAPSLTMVSFFVSLGFLFAPTSTKTATSLNLYMPLVDAQSIAWSVGVTCAMYASAGYGFLVLEAVGITASVTAGLSLYTLVPSTFPTWARPSAQRCGSSSWAVSLRHSPEQARCTALVSAARRSSRCTL